MWQIAFALLGQARGLFPRVLFFPFVFLCFCGKSLLHFFGQAQGPVPTGLVFAFFGGASLLSAFICGYSSLLIATAWPLCGFCPSPSSSARCPPNACNPENGGTPP